MNFHYFHIYHFVVLPKPELLIALRKMAKNGEKLAPKTPELQWQLRIRVLAAEQSDIYEISGNSCADSPPVLRFSMR